MYPSLSNLARVTQLVRVKKNTLIQCHDQIAPCWIHLCSKIKQYDEGIVNFATDDTYSNQNHLNPE